MLVRQSYSKAQRAAFKVSAMIGKEILPKLTTEKERKEFLRSLEREIVYIKKNYLNV